MGDNATLRSGCPTSTELAKLASGGTEIGVDVAEHVATCARCAAIIARGAISDDPRETLPPGTLVGRYEILGMVGQGGMGVVYRARDAELDREVALKLVAGSERMLDELTERLRRESRLQARAAHPAVITVHDIGRDGDRLYVAMELARGGTLRAWLRDRTRGWREIVDVFQRAGAGLEAAHAADLVHRDFKPDNVLVEERDGRVARVLVTDFGVARALEAAEQSSSMPATDLHVTATGAMVGTPAYMAPEQLGGGEVDARTDVFAFAVGLWEALYGMRPYGGDTITQIVIAMAERLPAPTARRGPRGLERVLRRALAIDPADRFQSMTDLVSALDASVRPRRWPYLVAAGGALATATVVVVFALQSDERSACDADPQLGALIDGAIARLAEASIPANAGSVRAAWIEDAKKYSGTLTTLREQTCRESDATSQARVQCLDQRGLLFAATIEVMIRKPESTRVHALRRGPPAPPVDCTAMPAWRGGDGGVPALFEVADLTVELEAASATNDLAAIDRQVAIAEAMHQSSAAFTGRYLRARRGSPEDIRELANAADRAGEAVVAARAWLTLAEGTARADYRRAPDLLAQSDIAIARIGNPPQLRAYWHAVQAYVAANAGDPAASVRSIQSAEALLATVPYDAYVETLLGTSEILAGRGERGLVKLQRVYDRSKSLGRVGPDLTYDYALALANEGHVEQGVAILEPVVNADPATADRDTTLCAVLLVTLYSQLQRADDTERMFHRWRATVERLFAHSTSLASLNLNWGNTLYSRGRFAEAEAASRRALELEVEALGSNHYNTADVRVLHGQTLLELDRVREGREEIERAVATLRSQTKPDDPILMQAEFALADALMREGRMKEALAYCGPIYDRFISIAPPADLPAVKLVYAKVLAGNGDRVRARTLVAEVIAAWAKLPDYKRELADARKFAKTLR